MPNDNVNRYGTDADNSEVIDDNGFFDGPGIPVMDSTGRH